VTFLRRLGSIYARIARTYLDWTPGILALALVVFVPLGLIDAVTARVGVDSLNPTNGIEVAAVILAVGAIAATGLLGEVFFSGAIAVALTHPDGQRLPPLSEIARRLKYGRLIVVDLLYVTLVAVGLLLAVVPGVLAFIWFGLAGPTVELEERTPRGALTRSLGLVRGNFWLVFWVLVPIEIIGDGIGGLLAGLVHDLLGHTFVATWLAEALSNVALSPVFAVAAVLLTVELIWEKDGSGPRLSSAPA
jgi:hypothetical protein